MHAAFLIALDGLPLWAIKDAVKLVLKGQAEGVTPGFMPRPPELAVVVRSRLEVVYADVQRKAHQARLAAEAAAFRPSVVRTPESRARIAARLEELRAERAAHDLRMLALDEEQHAARFGRSNRGGDGDVG